MAGDQAKRETKARAQSEAREMSRLLPPKIIFVPRAQQDFHRASTAFPQLDALGTTHYPRISMKSWRSASAVATLCLLTAATPLRAEDEATLLRVFLRDGTSLVSFGEYAHAADRVVFSMPTASTPDPPLQLINL